MNSDKTLLGLPALKHDTENELAFKSIEEAVFRYVLERDALKEASATFDAIKKQADENMSMISMWLRDKGDELGVDSFNTSAGTAYRTTAISYRMGNWTEFLEWVKLTKNFQCLEKRVAKLATKEIHDAYSAMIADMANMSPSKRKRETEKFTKLGIDISSGIPPGIIYSSEVNFLIRRPNSKG